MDNRKRALLNLWTAQDSTLRVTRGNPVGGIHWSWAAWLVDQGYATRSSDRAKRDTVTITPKGVQAIAGE